MTTIGATYLKKPEGTAPTAKAQLHGKVSHILADVASDGDEALRRFSRQFDHVELRSIEVTAEEVEVARKACDAQLLEDMRLGIERVRQFAQATG